MDEALPIESLAGVPGAPARSQLSPKYWAFVSYSHHDQTWGDWLHKALETYRVPYKLVGRSSRHGKIPRRLFPIFRDCFELPAAGNLGAQLDEALQRSRYLVVVCSPSAAASRWVNEEIRTFKIIGGEDRVLALIVEGEPNASVRSDGKELECFPPALRFRVTPDGKISKTPAEPIAADVRPGQDSKAAAKLRLIAGLIGVSFDELRQRERRRRVWRVVQIGLSMLLVAALVQGVWIVQEIQKQTQLRRQAIENYVTLGQKELRAGSLVRAAVYLNQAYKRGEDSLKLRYLLGRALPALDVQAARLRDRGPPVVSTAFDAQGRYLLSLGQPSEVKVWDAAAGRLLATLDQHRAPVSSAVFSHDGKYIVTASYDRTAKIWEAHTGRLVHSLENHASLLETAVYSPDDALLVTLGADGTGHLWNPVSGKMLRELDRSFPAKVPVAFSPDGSRLVTAAGSRFAVLWSTAEGRVVQVLAGHKGRVNDARFSPDGKKLVTASDDGSLRIWQAERGDALVTWESGAGPLAAAAFLPDSRTLVVLSEGGTIFRYDSGNKQLLDTWQTGMRAAKWADFDPARMWLMLIAPDGVPAVWDAQSGSRLLTLDALADKALCAAINPVAPHVATGATDGAIVTWDLSRHARSLNLPGHGAMVNVGRFSPNGKWILTAGSDAVARIWNAESAALAATLRGHEAAVTDVKFDPTGSRIVTLALDGTLGLWSVPEGRVLRMLKDVEIEQAELSRDGRRLLVILGGRDAVLINAESWKSLAAVTGRTNLRCAAFSPDGNLAAIGSEDGTVDLRDGRTGALIRLLWAHTGAVNSVQFSADSSRLLTASADRTAVVSRVPDGNTLFVLEGHADAVLTACFSADDSRIITSSGDKSARIWSGRDGSLIASLADHLKTVSFAHFSPDGKFVVTGSDDGTAKVWSTTGQLLQSIETHAGEIQCAEFSPDSRRLITGAKEAVARVWDLTIEARSPSEVDELIRQRVPLRLAEIVEPSQLGAISTRDASRKHVSSSASPNGSLGTPEGVVCAFMRALDEGDPERVSALIATQCESRLAKLHERGAGRDELASIADLFAGATITETVHRGDGQAAFVEILLPKGLLTVYLSTEDSDWRITTMVGRPLAQQ